MLEIFSIIQIFEENKVLQYITKCTVFSLFWLNISLLMSFVGRDFFVIHWFFADHDTSIWQPVQWSAIVSRIVVISIRFTLSNSATHCTIQFVTARCSYKLYTFFVNNSNFRIKPGLRIFRNPGPKLLVRSL